MNKKILAFSLAMSLVFCPVTTFAQEENTDVVMDSIEDTERIEETEQVQEATDEETENLEESVDEDSKEDPKEEEENQKINLQYQAHIQNIGWQG